MIRSESKRSRTRNSVSPSAIARRSESRKSTSLAGALVHAEDGEERLLGDLHGADALHPLLPCPLLLQELALAGHVAAVALGQHVLAHGTDRLAADDMGTDCGLDRHLEQLPRDQLLELGDQRLPGARCLRAVDDEAERVDRLTG